MAEIRADRYYAKMANDSIGPRKTMVVLVIVVGCFAVLWPKVFYPMIVGSANQHMKPSPIDKTTGCCDVISETDVHTIKIMSELCSRFSQLEGAPQTTKEIISTCKAEVLKTCGIDLSAVLQEKVMLGHTFKQIVDEVRSLNGSLCLKYNFGVSPWRLGIRHVQTVSIALPSVPQERPPHLRSEIIHPAFRERGAAIPHTQPTPSRGPPPRIIEGKPGPIPGMRPPMGGAGHVVPPSHKGSSMSIIMPIYTIGIVIFFSYTLMKLLFKKQPDGMGAPLYPNVIPDRTFRKEVFESADRPYVQSRLPAKNSTKLGDTELDHLRKKLRETELAMERIVEQMNRVPLGGSQAEGSTRVANGNIANGSAVKQHDDDQTSVKVLGMEMTASCEGGQKWTSMSSSATTTPPPVPPAADPPQEIYLEGALPAQSKLLVADSATETQRNEEPNDPAVVLAGKMTLSLISDVHEEKEAQVQEETDQEQPEVNGSNHEEDMLEESKYTTASSATAAENDISGDEQTDDQEEEVEVDVEIEEIEEDQVEINDEDNKPNHVRESSGSEE